MIEISYKRYGELVGSAVRVSELEQELAQMTKNFEMQTENVQYWKSQVDLAREDIRAHEKILRQKDSEIKLLVCALEESSKRLANIVIAALGAE